MAWASWTSIKVQTTPKMSVIVYSGCYRPGFSKRFRQKATWAITQQFEGWASHVMFQDMLHSTKLRNCLHKHYFFLIDKMSLRPDDMAPRAGFGRRAVVW